MKGERAMVGVTAPHRGVYIALEGIDGSGTTTHSIILRDTLSRLGYCSVRVEEPSSSVIGSIVRGFLRSEKPPSQRVFALLFAADRVYQAEKYVSNLLEDGCIVVSDRSWVSSLVYQAYDNLPGAPDKEWVYVVNRYAPRIDVLVLLDVDPLVAYARLAARRGREYMERLGFLRELSTAYKRVLNLIGGVVGVTVTVKVAEETPVNIVSRAILTRVLAAVKYLELEGRRVLSRSPSRAT